jgi:hypothetical protein
MSIRESSPRSGFFMKKKVINDLYEKYVETKRKISDDEINKMFLDATNGKFVQNKNDEDKLVVDLDGNFDILQGLLNKETDFSMKDMFKIKHSDFINRFIGITVPQESITKICKDIAQEYANLRIKNNKAPKEQLDKEMEDAFNYCLINTNHMFSQEMREYKKAFEQANKDRLKKMKPEYYLPHWVVIAMKLPNSTLNWNRSMLGKVNMAKQINSFLKKYNKRNGQVPGYYEFLNIENPLSNGGRRKIKRKKTLKRRWKNKKNIRSKRYKRL